MNTIGGSTIVTYGFILVVFTCHLQMAAIIILCIAFTKIQWLIYFNNALLYIRILVRKNTHAILTHILRRAFYPLLFCNICTVHYFLCNQKHTCFCASTFLSSSLCSDEDLSVVWKCLGKWVIHSLCFWKCHHREWEKSVILWMRKVVNYSAREEMVKEFIQRYHKFVLSVSKFLDHFLN